MLLCSKYKKVDESIPWMNDQRSEKPNNVLD